MIKIFNHQGKMVLGSNTLCDKTSCLFIAKWVLHIIIAGALSTIISDLQILIFGISLHIIYCCALFILVILYSINEAKIDQTTIRAYLEKIDTNSKNCIIPVHISFLYPDDFGGYFFNIQFLHCGTLIKIKSTCQDDFGDGSFVFPNVKEGQLQRTVSMVLIFNKSRPSHYYLTQL